MEESDNEDGAFGVGIDVTGRHQEEPIQAFSYFSLMLNIEEGVVSMLPEVSMIYECRCNKFKNILSFKG